MKKVLMMSLCCLLLTACASRPDVETSATPSTAPTVMTTVPETTEAPTVPETEPVAPILFTVYAPNDTLDGFVGAETEVTELTADAVVQALIEAGVLDEAVAVNNVSVDGTTLNLDLNSAFYDQLVSFGSAGERYFVGSVVNTFLSAYGVETVSITVDGQILESGHVAYDFPMDFFE